MSSRTAPRPTGAFFFGQTCLVEPVSAFGETRDPMAALDRLRDVKNKVRESSRRFGEACDLHAASALASELVKLLQPLIEPKVTPLIELKVAPFVIIRAGGTWINGADLRSVRSDCTATVR